MLSISLAKECPRCHSKLFDYQHACYNCLYEFEQLDKVSETEDTQKFGALCFTHIKIQNLEGKEVVKPIQTKCILVGRDARADIILNDIHVSRKHLEISLDNKKCIARDLSSLNSTHIDGQELKGAAEIDGESIIDVCGFILRLTNEMN